MTTILRSFDKATRLLAVLCGWGLLAIALATVAEILGRKFFDFSFRGVDEVGAYIMATVSSVGFAYALSRHAHMRVALLFGAMGKRMKAGVNLLAALLVAGVAIFCVIRGGIEVLGIFESGQRSATPMQVSLWIPRSAWLVGMIFFALGATIMAAHSVHLFVTDREELNSSYGPEGTSSKPDADETDRKDNMS
ncbi:TRAP transporter small permease subunit [Marinibacterium sp. SX1]|uniref:TRAP transporter small permease subunit n=1 Tax=Marinibacterium sp. SX1 TaxID=3388424 RepID=UPI003D16AFE6